MAEEVEDILVQEFDTTLNVDDVPMTVSELHEALQTADAICPAVTRRVIGYLKLILDKTHLNNSTNASYMDAFFCV